MELGQHITVEYRRAVSDTTDLFFLFMHDDDSVYTFEIWPVYCVLAWLLAISCIYCLFSYAWHNYTTYIVFRLYLSTFPVWNCQYKCHFNFSTVESTFHVYRVLFLWCQVRETVHKLYSCWQRIVHFVIIVLWLFSRWSHAKLHLYIIKVVLF